MVGHQLRELLNGKFHDASVRLPVHTITKLGHGMLSIAANTAGSYECSLGMLGYTLDWLESITLVKMPPRRGYEPTLL